MKAGVCNQMRFHPAGAYLAEVIDKHECSSQSSMIKKMSKHVQTKVPGNWPESITRLAGAWKDLPLAEEIRAKQGKDAEREPL